jgi:RimJ/RimL family protein N-acetyltransferase
MEHFVAPLSRAQSQALLARIELTFEQLGYGLWAVQPDGESGAVGFVGLCPLEAELPFAPGVELGWRLARSHWGRGLAYECACASADFAFERLGLEELVATTAAGNVRSRRLMERLGMERDQAGDFDHPRVPAGHPLAPHVLYRLSARAWARSPGSPATASPPAGP